MLDEIKEPQLDGVDTDDPNAPDEEPEAVETETERASETETPAAEPVQQVAPEPKTEEPAKTEPAARSQEVEFTPEQQAKIDRLVSDRLARDRATRAKELEEERQLRRELEAAAGVPLAQLKERLRQGEIERLQTEHIMSEEQARELVEQQERLRIYEATEAERKRQSEESQKEATYLQAKLTFQADPKVDAETRKFATRYAEEIDAFAAGGKAVAYDVAVRFVLGQHLEDIIKERQVEEAKLVQAAEQRTLAQVQKRAKIQPETTNAGAPHGTGLTEAQRQVARSLGITDKEYAESLARIAKKR